MHTMFRQGQEGLLKDIDKNCKSTWKLLWLEDHTHLVKGSCDKIVKINLRGKAS